MTFEEVNPTLRNMRGPLVLLVTFVIGTGLYYVFTAPLPINGTEVPAIAVLGEPRNASKGLEDETPALDDGDLSGDRPSSMWLIPDDFKGMREVWTVSLSKDEREGKVRWKAVVLTSHPNGEANEADDFSAASVSVSNDRLSFTTKTQRRIRYQLKGEFQPGSQFADDGKVFKGTMKKFVNGKLRAQFTDYFKYKEPHCWH